MKFVFVSNFINHHQMPFCEAMLNELQGDFCFVQTEPMSKERITDGWGLDGFPSYVLDYISDREGTERLILESDALILGWSALPRELVKRRLEGGNLTFRVSERLYREGQHRFISPKGLADKYDEHIRYRKAPVYLLCAGAYVASDFALIKSYPGRMYKWGYFPETRMSPASEIFAKKDGDGKVNLLFAGRMVPLKHPEFAIRLAKELTDEGVSFALTMIGDGPERAALEEEVSAAGMESAVTFRGTLTPPEVRDEMEKAHVFLFTSNYLEGWGAVVNEAMNAACAVVASSEAGAVPFLIRHGANGLVYDDGRYEAFAAEAKRVISDTEKTRRYGEAAYNTIRDLWNAETAAKRMCEFTKALLDGDALPEYNEGPLSKADVIPAPGFIRTRQEINRLQ